jgi:hypothetical protein
MRVSTGRLRAVLPAWALAGMWCLGCVGPLPPKPGPKDALSPASLGTGQEAGDGSLAADGSADLGLPSVDAQAQASDGAAAWDLALRADGPDAVAGEVDVAIGLDAPAADSADSVPNLEAGTSVARDAASEAAFPSDAPGSDIGRPSGCGATTCDPTASCDRSGSMPVCLCPKGYADTRGDGSLCADINECAVNNGGCDPLAGCSNTPGSRSCGVCPSGYSGTGESGCVDLNECVVNNGGCDPRTTCTNTPGSRSCGPCPPGYIGGGLTGCADIDECAVNNGGCDPRTTCTNTAGSRSCGPCPLGYTGDGLAGCTDIDECATRNGDCDANATCRNVPGGRTCTCATGYVGNGTSCLNDDPSLVSLTLSEGTPAPPFSTATTSYTASVAGGSSSITVTATALRPMGVTIKVGGTTTISGSPSGPVALSVGTTDVVVDVVAAGAARRSYTVSVTRPGSIAAWTELTLQGGPSGPMLNSGPMVNFDATTGRLIVFYPSNPSVSSRNGESAQVWLLDHANGLGGAPAWTRLTVSGELPDTINGNTTAVYTPQNRLIVYGGCGSNCAPAQSDVYMLANANGLGGPAVWSHPSISMPRARSGHQSAFDPSTNRMVSFGGNFAFFGTDQNDTAIFDVSASSWSTPTISGAPPGPRAEAFSSAYDASARRMIVFGGDHLISTCCPYNISQYNDLWVLKDANGVGAPAWQQVNPVGSPPSARGGNSAVFDSVRERLIIYGGSTWSNATQSWTALGDLWQVTHANGVSGQAEWSQLFPTGDLPGSISSPGAAFDSQNQRMMVVGMGDVTTNTPPRVWVLALP